MSSFFGDALTPDALRTPTDTTTTREPTTGTISPFDEQMCEERCRIAFPTGGTGYDLCIKRCKQSESGTDIPITIPEEERIDPITGGGDTTTGVPCTGGYKIDNRYEGGAGGSKSIWTDEVLSAAHGWQRSPEWEGHIVYHPNHGYQKIQDVHKFIQYGTTLPKGNNYACAKGYRYANGYCCPVEASAGQGGALGEYKYPDWLTELMEGLSGRAQDFLTMPTGFTQQAMDYMFGQNFDKIRGRETARREGLLGTLGREGMLGTGARTEAMQKEAWRTEDIVSELMRNLFVENEMKKKQDILDYTKAAQDIYGTGLTSESILEGINAARRNEEFAMLEMLFRLLGIFAGG